MTVYSLDTHTLWWFLTDDVKLSKPAKEILKDSSNRLLIPAVVLAELKWAYLKGKFPLDTYELCQLLSKNEGFIIRPITSRIVNLLPAGLELHDGLICATCLDWSLRTGESVALITKDKQITQSGILPVFW